MGAGTKKLEAIVPRLAPGKVTVNGDTVKYVRSSDGQQLTLPSECLAALNGFLAGKSVRKIILETYQKGLPVDFVALKHTLYSLYWAHHLLNEHEYKKAIETTDWMPVSDTHLLNPLIETSISGEGAGTQGLIFVIVIATIVAELKLLLNPEKLIYGLLLFPMAFLNLKGILSAFISAIYSRTPQQLNLHVSPLGVYVRESSEKRRYTSNYEYFAHSLVTIALGAVAYYYFKEVDDDTISKVGVAVAVLLVAILHSPAHRSDLSNLFISIQKKETATSSFGYFYGVSVFILAACAFSFATVLDFFYVLYNYQEVNPNPHIALLLLTSGLFLDLLDNFDFIFDQVMGRFVSPAQSSFSRLFKKQAEIDLPKVFHKIPIFQSLPDHILREMIGSSRVVEVRQGVTICKTGQLTTDLFIIVKGRVGIYNPDKQGRLAKIMDLEEGSIFGEGSFFLDRPRKGDAIASTSATILCVKRPKEFEKANRDGKVNTTFQRKI